MNNPLLGPWHTDFAIPPFEEIDDKHYGPALTQCIGDFEDAVARIVGNPAAPDFDNTIIALELAEVDLQKIYGVFSNLATADSNDALNDLEREFEPKLASLRSATWSNPQLYERVRGVAKDSEGFDDTAVNLIHDMLRRFQRAGADLSETDRSRVAALELRLATLCTRFQQNVRSDAAAYELILESGEETSGLPASVLKVAAAEAARRGHEGKFVFTISRSSITPFLQYAERRDLRKAIYEAYTHCGDNDNDYNNRDLVLEIVGLRRERARLLGFSTHAEYMLDDRMAKTPDAVRGLLDRVWSPARRQLNREAADLRATAGDEIDELQPWDWWFYTERLQASRFDLNPAELRAYFPLQQVVEGAFEVAGNLYGLRFQPLPNAPRYREDIDVYEVLDADDSHLGIFITDYYQRPSKGAGAWMNEFRCAHGLNGDVRPIVINCCNFSRGEPTLLDMDEVRTLFHELGHGLHGLLTRVKYPSLSGTRVKQDFVELPSQIMEHWAIQAQVLRRYAKHFQTGEPIPEALIDKLRETEKFNQGFATTEYLAACYLDLAWHEVEDVPAGDIAGFEASVLRQMGLEAPVAPRYRSTYFKHIFAGDHYSAGYYVYLWAEVLDADAFSAFAERGIFHADTAKAFRRCILEAGGTSEPMSLYRAFRGRDPAVEALLEGRGLLPDAA